MSRINRTIRPTINTTTLNSKIFESADLPINMEAKRLVGAYQGKLRIIPETKSANSPIPRPDNSPYTAPCFKLRFEIPVPR